MQTRSRARTGAGAKWLVVPKAAIRNAAATTSRCVGSEKWLAGVAPGPRLLVNAIARHGDYLSKWQCERLAVQKLVFPNVGQAVPRQRHKRDVPVWRVTDPGHV
jgi:hypothetical protein